MPNETSKLVQHTASSKQSLKASNERFAIETFMKTLKKKQQNAGMIVSKIATTVLASQSAKDFLNDSATFIVDMSPEIHKGLKDGVIKLVEENGNLYAQLKDSNNHYSKNSL